MVVDALVHHPSVTHFLRFTATTVGRDKALRTVQYLARFLSWYLLHKGYTKATIEPWNALKKNFGTARKAMRIGKNVEHLKAFSEALDNKTLTPVARYLTAGRQLGYFGYLTLDTINFLASNKVFDFTAETQARLTREAQRLWMTGILFSLAHSIYKLQQLKEKAGKVVKTEPEGRLEDERLRKEKKAIHTQLVQDSCDAIIPATALGFTGFDEGLVGLAGTVSSYIGLKAAWAKTAV